MSDNDVAGSKFRKPSRKDKAHADDVRREYYAAGRRSKRVSWGETTFNSQEQADEFRLLPEKPFQKKITKDLQNRRSPENSVTNVDAPVGVMLVQATVDGNEKTKPTGSITGTSSKVSLFERIFGSRSLKRGTSTEAKKKNDGKNRRKRKTSNEKSKMGKEKSIGSKETSVRRMKLPATPSRPRYGTIRQKLSENTDFRRLFGNTAVNDVRFKMEDSTHFQPSLGDENRQERVRSGKASSHLVKVESLRGSSQKDSRKTTIEKRSLSDGKIKSSRRRAEMGAESELGFTDSIKATVPRNSATTKRQVSTSLGNKVNVQTKARIPQRSVKPTQKSRDTLLQSSNVVEKRKVFANSRAVAFEDANESNGVDEIEVVEATKGYKMNVLETKNTSDIMQYFDRLGLSNYAESLVDVLNRRYDLEQRLVQVYRNEGVVVVEGDNDSRRHSFIGGLHVLGINSNAYNYNEYDQDVLENYKTFEEDQMKSKIRKHLDILKP